MPFSKIKFICIEVPPKHKSRLTLGKSYYADWIDIGSKCLFMQSDDGLFGDFDKRFFITIEQLREEKLIKLGI